MASRIDLLKENQTSNIIFAGPAKQHFDSLKEQAIYFLDNFWPNWKNYDKPQSYLLPPVFKYENPEVSAEAFKIVQQSISEKNIQKPQDVITHRVSEEAEHVVYDALQQLIQDEIRAPFVAVHSLDLRLNFIDGNKLHGSLTKLFPLLNWNEYQEIMERTFLKLTPNIEYDFILIGPKIGIIAVEVKSSDFKDKKSFKTGNGYLPKGYEHGLAQMEAAHALIFLLEECTGIPFTNDARCLRKILFTPNLEKERIEKWISSLNDADRLNVNEKRKKVVQLFKEDMNNNDDEIEKPLLYSKLKQILENGNRIENEIYEAYCPIISAMASITLLAADNISNVVEIDQLNFSKLEASLKEHARIVSQNPSEKSQLSKSALLEKAPKEIKRLSKIVFLSPDQQKALRGSSRQFILGTAGVGKTIILQSKAIELLKIGQSVVVLTSRNFKWRYKILFDDNGFRKYKICRWADKIKNATQKLTKIDVNEFTPNNLSRIIDDFVESIVGDEEYMSSENLEWLLNFDNVFIDDCMDETDIDVTFTESFLFPIVIMVLAQKLFLSKTIWIAMDPYAQHDSGSFNIKLEIDLLLDSRKSFESCYGVTIYLNK